MRIRRIELREYSKGNNLRGIGKQNLSTQNKSLWQENQFRPIIFEKEKTEYFFFTSLTA